MTRWALTVAVAAAVAGASCSPSAETGGITSMDPAATRACAGLTQVMRERASGSLSAATLRTRVGAIYGDAEVSNNPLIRTRAVALFADATVMASGGEAGRLDADLAAMDQVCTGAGG